ncbi:MAG: DUF6531 domain-containing protein [Polyangiales bacterium]
MIASTWLDLVVGLDIHFEMVPMPAPVPTPFPHPFVGMVSDPAGLAMGIAISNTIGMAMGGSFKGPVLIWGMPANTTGTEAKNSFVLPHFIIPPGTMWTPMPKAPKPPFKGKTRPPDLPVAPAGDAVMITGSKTVTTMGSNQCRLGDLAMSCAEPVRLPSSAVIAIPKGPIVLVGGPPAVDWVAAAMAFIKTKTIANELHGLVGRIKSPRLRNFCHWLVCTLTGHPVDVATGRVMTRATDWELPGPIPLTFERHYSSAWSNRDSPLGYGWSHSLDQAVWIERGCVVYRAGDGREVEFDTFPLPDHAMRPGDEVWDPFNRLTLRNTAPFAWEVETPEGLTHHFATVKGGDPKVARLTRIADRAGHEVLLTYDPQGRLDYARDAGGRIVRFEHDARGRLVRVALPHPSVEGWVTHTRYAYTDEGELASATDPLGHATRFEYAGEHLLVRESDRCGFSFHFGYDGAGTDARCVRTWGDGGVYDHALFYDPKARRTTVTDSLGNTTLYEFNELNLLVKRTDPLGHAWLTEYDPHGWKTAEVDPLGNATRWAYDPRGRCVAVTTPDAAEVAFTYDAAGDVVEQRDAVGGQWAWSYDARGRLTESVNPAGQRRRFHHGALGLTRVDDVDGSTIAIDRDARGMAAAIRRSNGGSESATYDRRGRPVEIRDARGALAIQYDACGRALSVRDAAGRERRFSYDGEGNVTAEEGPDGPRTFRYVGHHWLAGRGDGPGPTYEYDTEGRVVRVRNELGEASAVEYGPRGDVLAQVDFGGRRWRYVNDALGRPVEVVAPDGSTTRLEYDAMDRVTREVFADGEERAFRYRADGLLLEARNALGAVVFARDPLGRIVSESFGDDRVESAYDVNGERVAVRSSRGLAESVARDALGRLAEHTAQAGGALLRRAARWSEDGRARDLDLDGAVCVRSARDELGREASQAIVAGGREVGRTQRTWDARGRLAMAVDPFAGPTRYEYDPRGRPTAAWRGDRLVDARFLDDAGNAYDAPALDDRAYGPGGQLHRTRAFQQTFDACGRLVERRDADGRRRRFEYNAIGQLVAVLDDGREAVRFAYDALGRRVRKQAGAAATTWVWDGASPIHEVQGGEARTWVYDPDSGAPCALLERERVTHLVCDDRGAPTHGFDQAGALQWRAELHLSGRVADGPPPGCPWRFEGHYADEETGLHYNRFRYYDPETCTYLTPDPVGLLGGVAPYAYVDDPLRASDPYGLGRKRCEAPREQPPNTALIMLSDGHAAVRVVTASGRQTTHRVLENVPEAIMERLRRAARSQGGAAYNGRGTRVVSDLDGFHPHTEILVPFANAEAAERALAAQRGLRGTGGTFSQGRTNCVTHVEDVLRAGGVETNHGVMRGFGDHLLGLPGASLF